jgi:hypothetical protein
MQTVYALVAIWRKDGRSLADFGTGSTVVDVLSLSPPEPASFVEQVVASMLVIVAPIIALLIFMMVCATLFGQMVVQ